MAEAIRRTVDAGVDEGLVTMTTDGNASVPMLLPDGSRGAYEKSLGWLWDAVVEPIGDGLSLTRALSFATVNPARALGLADRRGRIRVGGDADLLVLSPELAMEHVFGRGRHLVAGKQPMVRSLYEPDRV